MSTSWWIWNPDEASWNLGGLQRDLEKLLAVKVDVVSSRGLRDRVRERVLEDAVPL